MTKGKTGVEFGSFPFRPGQFRVWALTPLPSHFLYKEREEVPTCPPAGTRGIGHRRGPRQSPRCHSPQRRWREPQQPGHTFPASGPGVACGGSKTNVQKYPGTPVLLLGHRIPASCQGHWPRVLAARNPSVVHASQALPCDSKVS